jgi:hypothetical protein
MKAQTPRPLRKTKPKEKAAHSPFADIIGKFYVSQELGRGQIVEETIPGQFKAECYASPMQPPPYIKYLSVENLTEILICKDKATWEGLCEDDEPCDCPECSDECDEEELCMCPDCFAERVANVKRMEAAESKEAIERTVQDTIADSVPSAETIAQCQSELETGRRNGYQK